MKSTYLIYTNVLFLNKFITPKTTLFRKNKTNLTNSNYRLVKKYKRRRVIFS